MAAFAPIVEPVAINQADIKAALKSNPEFFIQFFMGDNLTIESPEFHFVEFSKMISLLIKLYACAIPRDHAKTTLAKLASVYFFIFTDFSFGVYLSNTSTVADEACEDIIGFLECDNFKSVFGEVQFQVKQASRGFYKFTLFPGTPDEKECVLKALGAQKQVRGLNVGNKRPQFAIVDDFEDAEEIETEELYEKSKRWFYGTFRKALDKSGHKIIHLGNMVAQRCLIDEHCRSEYWHSTRYGCLLANGEPLWPQAWSIDKLREDFREYLQAGMIDVWFAEMMNVPTMGGSGLIKAKEIKYAPAVEPGMVEYGFITVDLAISDKTWAHNTAVVVHGWTGDYWQSCEYHLGGGIDPIALFDIIIYYCYRWSINVVGIENTAYQAALEPVFNYMCMVKNIENIQFRPLHAAIMRKTQRIAGWVSMIKDAQYYLTEGDFQGTQQLLTYNPKKKENDDDLIDAMAYAPQMIDMYIDIIRNTISLIPRGTRISNENLCEV